MSPKSLLMSAAAIAFLIQGNLAFSRDQPTIGNDYFSSTSQAATQPSGGTWTQRTAQRLASNDRWQRFTSLDGSSSDRSRRIGRFFDPERDRIFPIFGNMIRKAGYGDALPNPWGIGGNIAYMDQPMNVEQISIGVAGAPPEPIVEVPPFQIQSRDINVSTRIDLWALPIVNIYGIYGRTSGNAIGTVRVTDIGGLPPDTLIPVSIDYDGETYGGGATFAGAYKNIFFVFDMNYTLTDLDGLNRAIRARNYAPRVGIAGEKVQGWIGAFLLNTDKQLGATIDVDGIPVTITPELGVAVPWNFIYGFRWSPNKSIEFVVEHGFSGRNQVIGAMAFRF